MKLKKTHTYLGLPAYGEPQMESQHCIDQLFVYCLQKGIRLTKESHCASNVCAVRNNITKSFLAGEHFTHCLMIDSDMFFPPETLEVLLQLEKDIVGVIYTNKKTSVLQPKKIIPHAAKFLENGKCEYIAGHEGKPFKHHGFLGMGVMLIERKVLEGLPWPHFWAPISNDPENEGGVVGEDALFCRNAVDADFEVWVEPRLPIGHIGKRVYSRRDMGKVF